MKKLLMTSMILGTLLLTGQQTVQALEVEKKAPDFTLTDTYGEERSLSDYQGKYVVLEWVNFECPFVVKHYGSNNMQTLQRELTGQGDVVWLSINTSASEDMQGYYPPEEVNAMLAEKGASPTAYLYDTGEVGKMYGAKTTPHIYLIDPQGTLVYQGAIDDNPSFDPDDIPESTNYLTLALKEDRAGEAISNPSTKSYGCSVKY